MLTKRIVTRLLVFFQLGLSCFMPIFVNAGEVKIVIIDAGHGGKDPGALGSNSKEKDITLAIALKLGNYIETKLKGVKVIYTRKTDVFTSLVDRTKLANENNVDLFISIHANSAPGSPAANGTETLIMGYNHGSRNLAAIRENAVILLEENYEDNYDGFDPNAPETEIIFNLFQSQYISQSKDFAAKVENQFETRAGRKSRGAKQQALLVLYKTTMPGVLVETGFLTNPTEQKFLKSEKGQNYIASAIYRAFRDYKSEVEGIPISEFAVEENEVKIVEKIAEEKKEVAVKVEEGASEKLLVTKEHIIKSEVQEEPADLDIMAATITATTEAGDKKTIELVEEKKEEATLEVNEPSKKDRFENATVSLNEGVDSAVKPVKEDITPEPIEKKEMTSKTPLLRFKVQIKSSLKEIELIPENFNGLQHVSKYVDKGVNKFVFGNEDGIDAAVNLQRNARKAGFADAFVVAFADGKRIAMSEALKMVKIK